jgi:hypothetical protein
VVELFAADVEGGIEMGVDQDKARVLDLLADGSNRRDRDRVVAPEGDWDRIRGKDLADVALGGGERLLGVRQHDVAVAAVDRVECLHQVEVPGGVVGEELARDLADAARPVIGSRAADRGGIPGDAVDGRAGAVRAQRSGLGTDVRKLEKRAGQPGVEQ